MCVTSYYIIQIKESNLKQAKTIHFTSKNPFLTWILFGSVSCSSVSLAQNPGHHLGRGTQHKQTGLIGLLTANTVVVCHVISPITWQPGGHHPSGVWKPNLCTVGSTNCCFLYQVRLYTQRYQGSKPPSHPSCPSSSLKQGTHVKIIWLFYPNFTPRPNQGWQTPDCLMSFKIVLWPEVC